MQLRDLMSMSAEGIKRNRSRSLLTTLGIIIGVGSVVLMVSIGNSFERYILNQVESFGGGLIEIYPKGLEEYGGSLDTITFNDVD
ncbi:MAG TPA: ABC transporter permease, partial [Candidatus Peribacteraceae bacterium]|nr:ABC transporter permease [Candidatus Peribacteraceae bacterium]